MLEILLISVMRYFMRFTGSTGLPAVLQFWCRLIAPNKKFLNDKIYNSLERKYFGIFELLLNFRPNNPW
jgi:hypothetical protein